MTIAEIKRRLQDNTLSREIEQDEGYIVLRRLEQKFSRLSQMFLLTHTHNWVNDELSGYDEFVLAQNNLFLILIDAEEFKDEEEI